MCFAVPTNHCTPNSSSRHPSPFVLLPVSTPASHAPQQHWQCCSDETRTALRLAGVLEGSAAGVPSGSKTNLSLLCFCDGGGQCVCFSLACLLACRQDGRMRASAADASPPPCQQSLLSARSLDALRLLRRGARRRHDRERHDVVERERARLALADLLALHCVVCWRVQIVVGGMRHTCQVGSGSAGRVQPKKRPQCLGETAALQCAAAQLTLMKVPLVLVS